MFCPLRFVPSCKFEDKFFWVGKGRNKIRIAFINRTRIAEDRIAVRETESLGVRIAFVYEPELHRE